MLHLSEIHRVTGRAERSAELVHEAVGLLRLHELSPEDVDALAPVTCHAFFCLGALAYWEGRPRRGPAAAEPRLVARRRLDPAPVVAGQPRAGPHRRRRPRGRAGLRECRDRDGGPARRRAGHHRGPQQPRLHAAPPGPLRRGVRRVRRGAPRDPRRRHPRRGAHQLRGLRVRPVRHGSRPGRAPCSWAPRWPSATASAFRAWPFQEAALAPSVEAGRQRLGDEWEPLLERGAELGVLAAVATALRPAE